MRELLGRIDAVRREGAVRGDCGRVYRTRHGAHTLVAYADIAHADVVAVVEAEVAQARRVSGSLEWDVFGHDPRTELPEVLVGAGFVGEPKEQVLAAYATDRLLERWDAPRCEVRRVRDSAGIADIAKVSREVGRKNVEAESKHLAATLKDTRPTT